jgi:hypothetical protein
MSQLAEFKMPEPTAELTSRNVDPSKRRVSLEVALAELLALRAKVARVELGLKTKR